jgi:DNA mismatch repair protein MutL
MKIHLLDPIVAQRIAAGEVIERPASVMRELLDNAIDAKATDIVASVTEGGLEEIVVMDNGEGIPSSDLPLCCERHATSKVTDFEDLYHLDTMGFRGEALYSIAAVSRTTIASSFRKEPAFSITIDNGKREPLTPGGPAEGTKITVEGLFKEIPARRQFLKRPSTEGTMCKNLLIEKALAFPDISFRFYSNGNLKLDLPATSRKQRILDAMATSQNIVSSEMLELFDTAGRFSLYALASSPAISRSDRSHIKIYVNNRPVEEYSLVQAVRYGYGELLPGGSFPYCYLFITVDPTLADFNIHPTKREVKLRNKAEIHHQVVTMVGSQIRRSIPRLVKEAAEPVQPELAGSEPTQVYRPAPHRPSPSMHQTAQGQKPSDPLWFEKAKELLGQTQDTHMKATRTAEAEDSWGMQTAEEPYRYIGQAFNLFLVAEKGNELFLVDQHAAHERILFDEIREKKETQALMIPVGFEVDRDVDDYLQENLDVYLNLGIKLERKDELLWNMWTIPAMFKTIEQEVVSFIQHHTGDSAEVEKGLYAIVSCHAAIKSGDVLDRTTAEAILEKVFAMDDPCCPHGRTFVIRLEKDELAEAVGRT